MLIKEIEVNSLNTNDVYVLVDVDEYCKECIPENEEYIKEYPQLVTGFKFESTLGKDGYLGESLILDGESELEYFRKVEVPVFLVSGKKRSGKDHTAKVIQEWYKSKGLTVDLYAFADPIKTILCDTFGISLEELDYMKNTDQQISLSTGSGFKSKTMRQVIQNFGTEAMQTAFGVNVWKQKAEEFIENSKADIVIITDFRFPTEAIEGCKYISIKNDEVDAQANDSHKSENLLDDQVFDITLDNTGYPSDEKIMQELDNIELFTNIIQYNKSKLG